MKKCKVINRHSCTDCPYVDDAGEFGGWCERPKNTYCRGMWVAQDRNAMWVAQDRNAMWDKALTEMMDD